MDVDYRRDELACTLALLHTPGLGPTRITRLLGTVARATQIFEKDRPLPAWLPPASRNGLLGPDWQAVEHDLAWLNRAGNHHILTLADPAYPPLLREIPDPPPILFITGHLQPLSLPQLAIVGSRNPGPGGRKTAFEFARDLAGIGLVITSGLAHGIDAACHSGALAGDGITLAVTGCGPERIYPASHRRLANDIQENGALISEFPPGTPPLASHFPRRNRIISGLSLGTLVVEAARQSGSLITAKLAAEQGREIFAIPGSIHNPLAQGCHALIREGAQLVDKYQDIIMEIAPQLEDAIDRAQPDRHAASLPEPDDEQRAILKHIDFEPTSVDTVIARSGLTPDKVSSILLALEIENTVCSTPDGRYQRICQDHEIDERKHPGRIAVPR